MLLVSSLGVLLLAATCKGQGAPVSSADAATILRLHNEARSAVGLPGLEWDASLASSAVNGVDHSCRLGRLDHDDEYNDANDVGENLYYKSSSPTPPTDAVTAEDGTESWIAESDDYNYAANTCSAVCGHYTQIVWQGTTKVGCAIGACGSRKYLACHYKVPGNKCGWKPYGRTAAYECTCLSNGANLCPGGIPDEDGDEDGTDSGTGNGTGTDPDEEEEEPKESEETGDGDDGDDGDNEVDPSAEEEDDDDDEDDSFELESSEESSEEEVAPRPYPRRPGKGGRKGCKGRKGRRGGRKGCKGKRRKGKKGRRGGRKGGKRRRGGKGGKGKKGRGRRPPFAGKWEEYL